MEQNFQSYFYSELVRCVGKLNGEVDNILAKITRKLLPWNLALIDRIRASEDWVNDVDAGVADDDVAVWKLIMCLNCGNPTTAAACSK